MQKLCQKKYLGWQFWRWKCFVDQRGLRRTDTLVRLHRKPTMTQISCLYSHGEQKKHLIRHFRIGSRATTNLMRIKWLLKMMMIIIILGNNCLNGFIIVHWAFLWNDQIKHDKHRIMYIKIIHITIIQSSKHHPNTKNHQPSTHFTFIDLNRSWS